jgi:hypothetical protein
MVHFFGAQVSEGKPFVVHVPEGCVLNIVNVALASGNTAALSVETTGMDNVLVKVVLASLRWKTCEQSKVDVVFGSKAKFLVAGDAVVHMSGYYQSRPAQEDSDDPAAEIHRLTVDDLQELIQKAAERLVMANKNMTTLPSTLPSTSSSSSTTTTTMSWNKKQNGMLLSDHLENISTDKQHSLPPTTHSKLSTSIAVSKKRPRTASLSSIDEEKAPSSSSTSRVSIKSQVRRVCAKS